MNLEEFKLRSGFTTNQQVATAIGVSVNAVKDWSCGRKNPGFESQIKMEKFLEKQNVQKARFAQLRAARMSDADLDAVIEARNY